MVDWARKKHKHDVPSSNTADSGRTGGRDNYRSAVLALTVNVYWKSCPVFYIVALGDTSDSMASWSNLKIAGTSEGCVKQAPFSADFSAL